MKSSDRFQTLSDWSRRALTVAVALLTVLAIGCGGNGAGRVLGAPLGTPTRATSTKITFVWPKRSRLIPIAANSINLTLTTPGHTYPKLITRPEAATSDTSLITFDNIVPGDYTVTAQAFPNSDGTGNVQATGSSTFTVAQGVQGSFTVTMLSTVTKVTITGPTTLLVGKNGTFTAKAYDAADVAVLVETHFDSCNPC